MMIDEDGLKSDKVMHLKNNKKNLADEQVLASKSFLPCHDFSLFFKFNFLRLLKIKMIIDEDNAIII